MSTGQTGKITKSFSLGGQSLSIPADSATADTTVKLETTVNDGMTNFHRVLSVDASEIVMMGIHTTKAITIKTNSSSAPDQTFSLLANQGIVWSVNDESVTTCPIDTDITDVYITNASGATADVKMYFLIDQPGVGS